jgi:hypothetical protein
MLDMGFEESIREIISQIRPDRQMLLWSAVCLHLYPISLDCYLNLMLSLNRPGLKKFKDLQEISKVTTQFKFESVPKSSRPINQSPKRSPLSNLDLMTRTHYSILH